MTSEKDCVIVIPDENVVTNGFLHEVAKMDYNGVNQAAATIRTVAAEAGVSISTVSRYINHPEKLNPGTYARIEQAVRRTGYVPNLVASGLKSGTSRIFLLFVPDICNPFYSKMARTLQKLTSENGSLLMIIDTEEQVERELAAIATARQIFASGIFAASVYAEAAVLRQLAGSGAPVVGINSYPKDVPFDAVGVHHMGGTYLAVEHLIGLGHRDIAFAGGKPGTVIGESRKNGYLCAMRNAGLEVRPDLICEEGFSQEAGYRAGIHFARSSRMATAICCANDLIAFGVIRALTEMGISVPNAISVTGMDDTPFCTTSSPELTSVTNDGALFASRAFEMMRERVEHRYEGAGRFFEVPNELIVRGSTTVPRILRVL